MALHFYFAHLLLCLFVLYSLKGSNYCKDTDSSSGFLVFLMCFWVFGFGISGMKNLWFGGNVIAFW